MSNRKTPSLRSDFIWFETVTTRWNDNDVFGHMNNTVHYALFDSAVNRWLFSVLGEDPRLAANCGLVVHSSCDYHAEPSYPHRIDVGLRAERLGSSSVEYHVALFSEGDDSCAAEGSFVHVYVEQNTKRPVRIDEPLRKALMGLMKPETMQVQ